MTHLIVLKKMWELFFFLRSMLQVLFTTLALEYFSSSVERFVGGFFVGSSFASDSHVQY